MKKVCLLAFVLFTWSIVVNAQESDGRYVEVTGSSEIEVVPDEIHFLVQI
ncbi:SIMPL domain-containing protein, partial [Escherichia coli]|nr:SIMPL domain-containing protein [Escherichia coli]